MATILRRVLVIGCVVACIACFLGSFYNKSNAKYTRAYSDTCPHSVFPATSRGAPMTCCNGDSYDYFTFHVCDATFHWSNRFITSFWPAWSIPMLPNAATLLHELWDLPSISFQRILMHLKRALFYVVLFAYRAVGVPSFLSICIDFHSTMLVRAVPWCRCVAASTSVFRVIWLLVFASSQIQRVRRLL
jgi:hypothetical protein